MSNSSRFITPTTIKNGGPQAAISVVENVSLRLKPNSIVPVLSLVGLYYALKQRGTSKRHYRRQKRELWDFFDPQGHHPIKF